MNTANDPILANLQRATVLSKCSRMNYHLKEIVLANNPEANQDWERYTIKPPLEGAKRLSNLSKINIFVGENNSGKSKFLRQLAATENFEFTPYLKGAQGWNWTSLAQASQSLRRDIQTFLKAQGILEVDGIVGQLQAIKSLTYQKEGPSPLSQFVALAKRLAAIERLGAVKYSGGYDPNSVMRNLKQLGQNFVNDLERMTGLDKLTDYTFTKLYFPTLRGLRNFDNDREADGSAKDPYREKTKTDYFGGKHAPEIFTGLSLYCEVQKLLLGNLAQRRKIADFEKFLAESFFEGKPVALIPKLNTTMLDIKIGDEAERPIAFLGDGIQSVIILTFPLFMNRDKRLLVFCEEPELYMHPAMQRVLLKVYSEQFQENQYFLTTHSNHFLDLTLDLPSVSVYTFRKELEAGQDERVAKFEVENVSNEDTRSLQLLGVRNSSVFLSNCTIWVEGITDRRYFREYLKLYQNSLPEGQRRFKEDLHYSFVEYGGANITHFSFLDTTPDPIVVDRLCSRLFLITDNDNATGAKAKRHQQLREKLKERYCCLVCKEVENLLTPEVIKRVVNQCEKDNVAFNNFAQEDYSKEPLGTFIETKVINGQKTHEYALNGTIKNKPDFCLKATAAMKAFDDISPEAKQIAKRLYGFIAENNK